MHILTQHVYINMSVLTIRWRSNILSIGKIFKWFRRWQIHLTWEAFPTWKSKVGDMALQSKIRRILRHAMRKLISRAWNTWIRWNSYRAHFVSVIRRVMHTWISNVSFSMSTAFYKLRINSTAVSGQHGQLLKSSSVYQKQQSLQIKRNHFNSWKKLGLSTLKSVGMPVLECLSGVFPLLTAISEGGIFDFQVDVDAAANVASFDVNKIANYASSALLPLFPDFDVELFAFLPEDPSNLRCLSDFVHPLTEDYSSPYTPKSPAENRQFTMSGGGNKLHVSPDRGESMISPAGDRLRQSFYSSSGGRNNRSSQFNNSHNFDDEDDAPTKSNVSMLGSSPNDRFGRSENIRQSIIIADPYGGDVGICGISGKNIVRGTNVSKYRDFQTSRMYSPAIPSRSSGRVSFDSSERRKSPSWKPSIADAIFENEDDNVYSAAIPIIWRGSVVGVLQLKSKYLSSAFVSALYSSGVDILGSPDCILPEKIRPSHQSYMTGADPVALQAWHVCTKLGLEIEHAVGLNAVVQLVAWMLGYLHVRHQKIRAILQVIIIIFNLYLIICEVLIFFSAFTAKPGGDYSS